MLITCPWCGARPHSEFRYCCDEEALPGPLEGETDEVFLERTFLRGNQIGFHRELWRHSDGCRGWLMVERHNLSHEIRAVEPARGPGLARQP